MPDSPFNRRATTLDGYSVLFTRAGRRDTTGGGFGEPEQWRFDWELPTPGTSGRISCLLTATSPNSHQPSWRRCCGHRAAIDAVGAASRCITPPRREPAPPGEPLIQEGRDGRYEPVGVIEPGKVACFWLNDELGVREQLGVFGHDARRRVQVGLSGEQQYRRVECVECRASGLRIEDASAP